MADNMITETAAALQQEWGIRLPPTLSKEAIIAMLEERLIAYLEKGPEAFYQLMYRLDISERKLHQAQQSEEIAKHIATLIYDRQLQKIESRHAHRKAAENTDPDLAW